MKIIYNVTIKIETPFVNEWLIWMQNIHIPEVMKTNCFESFKLIKILGDDDDHGRGYAIQYVATDMDSFKKYQDNHAKILQKSLSDRYANKYVAFRTLMEVVDESSL